MAIQPIRLVQAGASTDLTQERGPFITGFDPDGAAAMGGGARGGAARRRESMAGRPLRGQVTQGTTKIAREAGVKKLVLTHLLAEESDEAMVREAGAYFEGTVIAASGGLALDV